MQPHPSAQCNDAANQIYQSMRQSNGSNFFLNRKDTIVINGYLNKKSTFTISFACHGRLGRLLKGFYRGFLEWLINSVTALMDNVN